MVQHRNEESAGGLFGSAATETASSDGWITAYCDGGSRGNPGPSGFGVYIQDEGGKAVGGVERISGDADEQLCRILGLLAALNFALENGHPKLRVVSDSELMVKQIKGQYRVNSPELRPLYDEAKRRIARLEQFRIEHVLRGKNQQADRLANLAMDRGPRTGYRTVGGGFSRGGEGGFGVGCSGGEAAGSAAKTLRGLVKGGAIHLLEGELPEGVFVRVTPEAK